MFNGKYSLRSACMASLGHTTMSSILRRYENNVSSVGPASGNYSFSLALIILDFNIIISFLSIETWIHSRVYEPTIYVNFPPPAGRVKG